MKDDKIPNDQEAIEAAKTLIRYCESRQCENEDGTCPMLEGRFVGYCGAGIPESWRTETWSGKVNENEDLQDKEL